MPRFGASLIQPTGLGRYVESAVVLTAPQALTDFGSSAALVWFPFDLDSRIAALNAQPFTLPTEELAPVVTALKATVAAPGRSAHAPA